jgi:AraC family transcriptional regulator
MTNRELIYKSLDIIEDNLKENLNVYDISMKLGFSLYYFSRLFKAITGESPKSYMLKRKISSSVYDILHSQNKLIDIALDYGFGSPESYSRAFNKIIGINPSDLRKDIVHINHKLYPRLTKEKIENKEWLYQQRPDIIYKGPLYLVGIPFFYDVSMIDDLSDAWAQLINNNHLIKNKTTPENYFQVQYWFEDQDKESIFFFVAVEVTSYEDVPMQFTTKTLPKHKYLKFKHKGLSNKVGETYNYIYEKWLPDTNYKLPHTFNFEYYGPEHLGPYNEESVSEIYIPVKD